MAEHADPQHVDPQRNGTGDPDSQAQLEADIERKRRELAHTLDELGTRLDVKKQVGERVTTQQLAVAGSAVVALLVLVVWRRRR
jgi:hypothetical protein